MTSTALKLSSVAIFQDLDDHELAEIDRLSTEVDVAAGYVLARERSIGREFGIILEGAAAVSIDGAPVATLAAGDYYGEVALLAELGHEFRRSATVTATTDMRIAIMSVPEFSTLLAEFPAIAARLRETARARVAENAAR